ncbi:MAG: thiamine pyrophosphate-dependent enzyme [Methanoregula sp.]|nr:thiamine pyrophosphate-dependent enzyme [Methanoregula sp.]
MKGVDAIAAALQGCGDRFYAVPGYPVTDIATVVRAEIVINEKVALEYALGDSLDGRRAAVIIKNVGLNVCADPLINATTQGLQAGVVIIAGDDVLARGSQNTEDSRYFGELAQVPVIEPDARTCAPAIGAAFEASERFSRVAIVRVTPPLLENKVAGINAAPARRRKGHLASPDLTMRGRAQSADRIAAEMFSWSKKSALNLWKGGIVGAGAADGDSHAVTVYPPPHDAKTLAETRELGRPFVQEHRWVNPPDVAGKPETFSDRGFCRTFCQNCPFKTVIGILKEKEMPVICDMGCAVLAGNPPYRIGRACYALGSSVAVAARSTKVALTGDYALLHSGINALIDVYEKRLPILCIVLKNDRMGMTGGQPVYNLNRYLAWADPVICRADETSRLREHIVPPKRPGILIIEGQCPEGCSHETAEC